MSTTTAVEVTGLTIGNGDIFYQVDGDLEVDLRAGLLPSAGRHVLVSLDVDGNQFVQIRVSDSAEAPADDDITRTIEVLTAVRDTLSVLR